MSGIFLTEPPSQDSHGLFDQHFDFVTGAVALLTPTGALPARSVQAAACSMGLANLDHPLAETNASNARHANFEAVGMTPAEGLEAMAEALDWVGRGLDAGVMRQSAIELRGGTPDFSGIDEDYRTLVEAPAIAKALGQALRVEVPLLQVSTETRRQMVEEMVNAVPDEIYWTGVDAAKGALPQGMWEMPAEIRARLFHRESLGIAPIVGMMQERSILGRLLGGERRSSEHGVFSAYALETSAGPFHLLNYRDRIVLRSFDGTDGATRPNSMDYAPGTPGSHFWKHDEAPDWRLEKLENGRCAAAC